MTSGIHVLKSGINNYNISNINIVEKHYAKSDFAQYEAKMRSFPIGSYEYCIDIICVDELSKCEEVLESEITRKQCHDFTILPMTPLLLSSPDDEEVIETVRPNFTWIPPMPLGNDPDISYDYTLVKLNEDQRGEDGIRRNRPLYERQGIQAINLVFPSTLEDLERGERYAWQVKARLGDVVAGISEVWEFEVEEENEPQKYVLLSKTPNAAIFDYKDDDVIYFMHKSPYAGTNYTIRIKSTEGEIVADNLSKDLLLRQNNDHNETKHTGLNTYQLELKRFNLNPGIYTLILEDIKSNKFTMKFQIIE